MTIDLPQPHKEYDPARERVRNSRIKQTFNMKMDVDQLGHYLRLDPEWPFAGNVGFAIDGGNASSVYTDYIDGGLA